MKKTVTAILIFAAAALTAFAQTTVKEKKVEAIDTLSDDYRANFTIEKPPATQASRKVKYISGFSNDSVQGNTTSGPPMSMQGPAGVKDVTPENASSSVDIEEHKTFQSK